MTVLSRAIAAATEGVRVWPRWAVLTLAAIGFVLLWGLPTIIIPLATDQVLYALGARTILDGGQLYRDFWEIKPPLVYLVYTIPFALAGEHMESVRVLDLFNTTLAMGAVFLLTRRLFNERAAVFAAGFYGFTYLTWAHFDGLGEAESFMAAPLALAFFLYRPEDGRRAVWLYAAAAGALLGACFALKSTALLFVLGLPAAELLQRDGASWTAQQAMRRLALAGLGFVVVQAVLALYLGLRGWDLWHRGAVDVLFAWRWQNIFFATEMLARHARKVVQMHGGYGFDAGTVAERAYRDAKAYELLGGENQDLRDEIAGLL